MPLQAGSRQDPGLNAIMLRPGARPLVVPAPPCIPGKLVVRRVHAYVPPGFFATEASAATAAWVKRLLARYPGALRKLAGYLRTEGLRQTWAKIRSRAALERWSATYGAFAAVGVVVEGEAPGLARGATVLCWSWQGPVDASFHLVDPGQCLPVPDLAPEYARAPFLGWIVGALRTVGVRIAACRAVQLEPRDQAVLERLVCDPAAAGQRVVVGWGSGLASGLQLGELEVRLTAERAVAPLVQATPAGWVCRLPDPAHFFLDPYYPGAPEMPDPFGRAAVEETLGYLVRGRARGGTAAYPDARPVRTLRSAARRTSTASDLSVSCLGAGNYVRAVLVHHLRQRAMLRVRGVMDLRPEIAATQARALGADFCTTESAAVVEDPDTELVLVASDHASHAEYAVSALRAGKAVHLEKPAAVSLEQLERLLACIRTLGRPRLHLGYTRPFAPAILELEPSLHSLDGPTFVTCVVRGYRLGRAHWYNWPNQGTRIAGNLVHWIDLGYRLTGCRRPAWVNLASPTGAAAGAWDPLALSVGFDDGSLVSIAFSTAGDETFGIREYLDVKRQGLVAEIDDFRVLRIRRAGRRTCRRYRRDKGHAGAMAALARRVRTGDWDPAVVRDLSRTTAVQLAAQAALADGGGRQPVDGFLPPEGR